MGALALTGTGLEGEAFRTRQRQGILALSTMSNDWAPKTGGRLPARFST